MTDAVLRFLVELDDRGLTRLKKGLADVTTAGSKATKSQQTQSKQQTEAVNRILQAERAAAQRTVQNTAVRHQALRRQITDYQAVARAAKRGSDEEVAANLLAGKAQRRLERETGVAAAGTARAYRLSGAASLEAERDIGRLSRGALAGSGIFRGFGRSVAFASSAFLGGAGFVFALKAVYDETTKQQLIEKQLQAQLQASGISYDRYGAQIDAVAKKRAYLAAVDEKDVKGSLTDLIRTTGSVTAAEKLNSLALDVSAGAHVNLSTSTKIVAKVFSGNIGILKRYGIVLDANVKTPLQALIALQQKFAGQAKAAGDTTAGSFERAKQSIRDVESGLGEGALPVITKDLNALTSALGGTDVEDGARRLGRVIATDVDGAIKTVVADVKANWPTIKEDFHTTETILKDSAQAAGALAKALNAIASIVPGKGTILTTLVELYLGKRLIFGKGGSGGAAGLLEGLLGGAAGGAAAKGGSTLAKRLSLRNPGTLAVVGAGVAGAYAQKKLHEEPTTPSSLLDFSFKKGPALNFLLGHGFKSDAERAKDATKENAAAVDDLDRKYKQFAATAVGSWKDVMTAIKAQGGDLGAMKSKLDTVLKSEQQAARATAQVLDQAFSTFTGDVDQAFDAKTQQIVDGISSAYDDRLQKALDNITYKVNVVGKNIRESFTLHGDEKTPAERELDALDRIDAKHSYQRDIFDANQHLAQAKAIGDPAAIRDAQRALQDATDAKKRFQLQPRADAERKAADAAKQDAQAALQKQSDAAKQAATNDVTARRNLEKRHLDDTLAALLKEAEKGKIAGGKLAADVVAVLRKHDVDFKQAGDLLGKAFTTQLDEDLGKVKTTADHVHDAFDRIATTKDKIKDLSAEVKKLAQQLKELQQSGPADVGTAFTIIVGDVPKHVVPKAHALGGVAGGTGTGDTVPAMLTPGELILNARQQQGLAAKLGMPGAGPHSLFKAIQRFADGGVVDGGGGLQLFLRRLLEGVSLNALRGDILRGDILRGHGVDIAPTHIETAVNRSDAGGLSRGARLALMGTLAQRQAHPFTRGLLRAAPTGTVLGAHSAVSNDRPINIYLDGKKIATVNRSQQLRQSKRVAAQTRGRGANRTALGDRIAPH